MKKKIYISLFFAALLSSVAFFTGCGILENIGGKPPVNFTEGIDYTRAYEDDVLEIYDDAIVFDEFNAFDEAVLLCGSEDDFDDIVDFYKSFFEDNEITLSEEIEDRDEYYAAGVFEGFRFRVKIAEPDGEYIEDLFENIITLSTVEVNEETDAVEASPTPTPLSESASGTPKTTPEPTQDISRPESDQYETRLSSLEAGVWYCHPDMNPSYVGTTDRIIYIDDSSSGTMYYSDYYYGGRNWWDDFTYTIEDGIIKLKFPDGSSMEYFAYYDYDAVHFIATDDFSQEYYLSYYGTEVSSGPFSAFGDWLYYEPYDDFVGTIAFWPDGTGYVYNWYDNEEDIYFTWAENNGQITIADNTGDEIDTFTWVKRYNILEYSSIYENGATYFYNRVEHNLLPNHYELMYTSEEGLTEWQVDFYSDYSAYVKVLGTNVDYENDMASWYVDQTGGKLYIYMFDQYFAFDYHHFESGLLLYEEEDGNYYEFTIYD